MFVISNWITNTIFTVWKKEKHICVLLTLGQMISDENWFRIKAKTDTSVDIFLDLYLQHLYLQHLWILNTYRTAVSPTSDLLCHEDFNVGRSEA